MEIASVEFELYSSRKKLSRFKNFGTESNMENTFNGEVDDVHRKTYSMKEKKEGSYGNSLAIWIPSDKKAESSCSNRLASKSVMNCSQGKVCSKSYEGDHEVQSINERLRVLEKEAETMKQEFTGGLEERKDLMSEISQQFQIMRGRLRDRETGELEINNNVDLVLNPYKVLLFVQSIYVVPLNLVVHSISSVLES